MKCICYVDMRARHYSYMRASGPELQQLDRTGSVVIMAESSTQSQLGSVLATVFSLFILIILLVIKMSSISSKCYFQTFTLALMVTVSLTSSSTIMSKANKVDIPKVSQNIYVKEVKSIQVKISYN